MDRIRALSASSTAHSGSVAFDAFVAFARDNPALLFPAFEMQRKIQVKIMGEAFWRRVLERRIELTDDGANFVSVKQLLATRLDKVRLFFFLPVCFGVRSSGPWGAVSCRGADVVPCRRSGGVPVAGGEAVGGAGGARSGARCGS